MKTIILVFLLSVMAFGQSGKSVLSSAQITAIEAMIGSGASNYAVDTVALKAVDTGYVATLGAINTDNLTGGGIFVLIDSTFLENSIVAFDATETGKQWARLDYINDIRVINFGWTGADNTRQIDESAKFKACQDLAAHTLGATAGLNIRFPAGLFKLGIYNTTRNMTLTGEPAQSSTYGGIATQLYPPDTATVHIYQKGAYAILENLHLYNLSSSGAVSQTCEDGIYLDTSPDSRIWNCKISYYLGAGIKLKASFRLSALNNWLVYNGYGLYSTGNIAASVFTSCYFGASSINSIYLYNTTLVSFYDCDVEVADSVLLGGIRYCNGADTLIYLKTAYNINFYNIYNEFTTDPNARFMVIDATGSSNWVNIYSTEIGHLSLASLEYPISISGTAPTALNITNCRLWYTGTHPIEYDATSDAYINIVNSMVATTGGLGNERMVSLYNYNKDSFPTNPLSLANLNYYGSTKFWDNGGISDGIRNSGLGTGGATQNVINLPITYTTTAAKDTNELYVEFSPKLSSLYGLTYANADITIRYGYATDNGDSTTQIFKITYRQIYDGHNSDYYSYSIDTLFNTLRETDRLDSIVLGARTDSSFYISFYSPASANTRYLSGVLSGNSIGTAVFRPFPQPDETEMLYAGIDKDFEPINTYISDFSADKDGWSDIFGTFTGNVDGVYGQDDVARIEANDGEPAPLVLGAYSYREATIAYGFRYIYNMDYFIPSASTCNSFRFLNGGSDAVIVENSPTKDAWTNIGAVGNNPANWGASQVRVYYPSVSNGDSVYFKNVKITQIASYQPEGNHSIDSSSTYSQAGSYSAKITASGAGDNSTNRIVLDASRFQAVRNGIDYRFSIYAYTSTATTTLTFEYGDIVKTNVIDTGGMTQLNFDFTATTSTIGDIILYVDKAATIYIDEAHLGVN